MINLHYMFVTGTSQETCEKLNKFIPPEIVKTNPIDCEVVSFTKTGLMVKIRPWKEKPQFAYQMVFTTSRTPELVNDIYNHNCLFTVVLLRTDEVEHPFLVELQCHLDAAPKPNFNEVYSYNASRRTR